jgi:hypothetical protein
MEVVAAGAGVTVGLTATRVSVAVGAVGVALVARVARETCVAAALETVDEGAVVGEAGWWARGVGTLAGLNTAQAAMTMIVAGRMMASCLCRRAQSLHNIFQRQRWVRLPAPGILFPWARAESVIVSPFSGHGLKSTGNHNQAP